MTTSRRDFIQASLVAGGGLYLGLLGCSGQEGASTPDPLRILILGGTGFIGPHQVEYALARGHSVTLFNRGMTNPDLFPGVEKLVGDRNDNLEALKGREWDVVIDNPVHGAGLGSAVDGGSEGLGPTVPLHLDPLGLRQ